MSRSNGEGSIYRRKDGRWAGAAYVLTPDGTRKRKTSYGKTRKEVSTKLAKMQETSRSGIAATPGRLTVRAFLEAWMRDVQEPRLSPATYQTYEGYIRNHIVPAIGSKPLGQLTASDLREFLGAKTREGKSAATVKQIHAIIRSALQHAMREDLVPRNVAKLVVVSNPVRQEVEPLTPEEAKMLLTTAEGHPWEALWTLYVGLGLRRGEALGLRWGDIDLENGRLRVAQSLQRSRGELRLKSPKTDTSRRRIVLPAFCIDALRRHHSSERVKLALLGLPGGPETLAFTSQVGTPIEPRNVNRAFVSLLDSAGLRRVKLHDLRHTCASLLLAQGVAPRVVMELLGHSAIAVTMNTYSHVIPELQEESAQRMDALFR
ncbi:MAG: site-specific integrase [Brachybacterium sp.]|uniref:tyrosine-type recombinase/integrase n=1 Tax=Brachybacterium sp. TaxID=1891286 RepID=UPI00264A1AD4|nr:site-specific integrase [Brachybacterium sp.]MDN5686259.1 site-specific integrase [Brachybacterium sp.]